MRRLAVILGLCALLLPVAAWADGIFLTNKFGTVNVTDAGIVSSRSELIRFNHIVAPRGHALGSVYFSTGAFMGTDLFSGGTFSSVGSSFLVTGEGNYGQPKGTIFSGAFVGPISWTLLSHPGKWSYTFALSGTVEGMSLGRVVIGTTVQKIQLFKNQWLVDQTGGIKLGNTALSTPEPGTLGLLGTGLLAVAGTMRRRLFGS